MKARGPQAGIKDVARLAGVSVGTVSHVLNKPERVSDARKQLVHNAIEELGYVPNHAARQLKAGTSRLVGYLFPNSLNPYYANLALGVQVEAERRDLHVLSAPTFGDPTRERRYLSLFEQQRARGIVVVPRTDDLANELAIRERGTPLVLVNSCDPAHRLTSVRTDDHTGAGLVIEHLAQIGRRHILMVGPRGHGVSERRLAGARAAVRRLGGIRLEWCAIDEASIGCGRAVADAVLDRPADQRPDAMFATSDLIAIGFLNVAVASDQLRIPDDIAVAGYDDIQFAATCVIPLTSVRQDEARLGQLAIGQLEDEIADPGRRHPDLVVMPTLMPRRSTLG